MSVTDKKTPEIVVPIRERFLMAQLPRFQHMPCMVLCNSRGFSASLWGPAALVYGTVMTSMWQSKGVHLLVSMSLLTIHKTVSPKRSTIPNYHNIPQQPSLHHMASGRTFKIQIITVVY